MTYSSLAKPHESVCPSSFGVESKIHARTRKTHKGIINQESFLPLLFLSKPGLGKGFLLGCLLVDAMSALSQIGADTSCCKSVGTDIQNHES